MVLNQDFVMSAGNDFTPTFEVINETNGLPIPTGDIVGVNFSVSPFEDASVRLIEKTKLNGGIIIPQDGVIEVNLASSDTEDLFGEFSYELALKDASNAILTASRGKIRILKKIAGTPE